MPMRRGLRTALAVAAGACLCGAVGPWPDGTDVVAGYGAGGLEEDFTYRRVVGYSGCDGSPIYELWNYEYRNRYQTGAVAARYKKPDFGLRLSAEAAVSRLKLDRAHLVYGDGPDSKAGQGRFETSAAARIGWQWEHVGADLGFALLPEFRVTKARRIEAWPSLNVWGALGPFFIGASLLGQLPAEHHSLASLALGRSSDRWRFSIASGLFPWTLDPMNSVTLDGEARVWKGLLVGALLRWNPSGGEDTRWPSMSAMVRVGWRSFVSAAPPAWMPTIVPMPTLPPARATPRAATGW